MNKVLRGDLLMQREPLIIGMYGIGGKVKSPYDVLTSLLIQDILLTIYKIPKTIKEISSQIGVPEKYIANQIELLKEFKDNSSST